MYGNETTSRMDLVFKLNKLIYGLVQAPQRCFDKLSYELHQLGFKPSKLDQCQFYKENMVSLVYVDDVLFFDKDVDRIYQVVNKLK